jgi:cytochrome c-type biogenesis protein CcmH
MTGFLSLHAGAAAAAVLAGLAILAALFAAWPAGRASGTGIARVVLAAALGLFVLGVGGGAYLMLGTPDLARRSFAPLETSDVPGLVAALSKQMRGRPGDIEGWTLLGRGYLTLNDPDQAAIAFRTASELASPAQKTELLSAYAEAATLAAGAVTPDAERAFRAVLAANPKDFAARFYLGDAYAQRHDTVAARSLWQGLLADSPASAPWRSELIDRMAALNAQAGASPDIGAMVDALAARLKSDPDDLSGWQRLLRAYTVLGQTENARTALVRAQTAMRGKPAAQAALEAEAHALNLER